MVRTKANAGARASGGKAPRKSLGSSTTSYKADSEYTSVTNTMRIWPKPEWQKGVGCFFPVATTRLMSVNTTSETANKPHENIAKNPCETITKLPCATITTPSVVTTTKPTDDSTQTVPEPTPESDSITSATVVEETADNSSD